MENIRLASTILLCYKLKIMFLTFQCLDLLDVTLI